jgi:TolB-like protein/Flp pilus assembly protein TadD
MDRWEQIGRIFEKALDRDPAVRSTFVTEACAGDGDLRREVESLLRAHEQAGSFMEEALVASDGAMSSASSLSEGEPAHSDATGSSQADASEFQCGSTVGRYTLLEKLASGGMGVIYSAYDPELERKIAIKMLRLKPRSGLTEVTQHTRLAREAKTLAKLSHPNIVAVYDVGTIADQVFIAMELLEGETIQQWLKQRYASWRDVLNIFVQAGKGLAAAHAAGIVHGDFKPDNVVVGKDDRARVLDFGLAQAQAHLGADRPGRTQRGSGGPSGDAKDLITSRRLERLAGTPGYMAPEQLMGQPASTETDQFSFCVALYEGLYGERPFDTEQIRAKRLAVTASKNGSVPASVRRVVLKGLSADPAGRHPSMDALLDMLGETASRPRRRPLLLAALLVLVGLAVLGRVGWEKRNAGSKRIQSIAVLPLENLTGDPSQEYFVDGVTEAMITDLAQISALRVISRTSVMKYKGNRKPLRDIAKALGVDAVMEGSITRSGDRVHVTAQLIDASTDRHIWAKGYDREMRDILALQRDVARAVAAEIAIKLKPEEQARLAAARSVDPEVYLDYLQGRFYWYKRTPRSIEQGIEYFKKALDKDPNYAPAYAGLGDCYAWLSTPIHALSPSESARLTKDAVIKALSLDDALAEAHATLGLVIFRYDWDWARAEKEFKRAIELNPSYVWARVWYGTYLMSMKRKDEALAEFQRAISVDPLSSTAYTNLAQWFVHDGQYDRAIEQYLKSVELGPTIYTTHFFLAEAYERKGMYEEAIAAMKRSAELSGDNVPSSGLAGIYASSGKRAEAQSILEQAENHPMANRVAFWIAAAYATLGRKDDALRWLERAYEAREFIMPWLSFYWRFDPLRSDARFTDLVRRMGLPQ